MSGGARNVDSLRSKLIAGKNEQQGGYQKFATAQFYENLTSEQYTGVMPRQINALSVSKDTLNPLLNTTILKQRLNTIEYYKNLHGAKYAYWPHYFMGNMGNKLWKYKFNYAVKGFAAYMLINEVQNYRNLNEKTVMTIQQGFEGFAGIGISAGILGTVCALI